MSSERSSEDRDEPGRQVSDDLMRKASEGPIRRLPDALFGPAGPVADTDIPSGSADADAAGASTGQPENLAAEENATRGEETADTGVDTAGSAVDTADAGEDTAGNSETAEVADGSVAAGTVEASWSGAESASENTERPVLVVIADSLSYFGPKGGLPADHPRIWPNLVAAELDWDVELVGRIGWTSRDAYWALIGDPRIWAAVPRAGAVVLATGGMDTLPSPLPTALRELIRYLRPPMLRRQVRTGYQWLQPRLSKLGRPVALPPHLSVDYLEQSRQALEHLRPELPVVSVLPSVHDCEAYGRVHAGREPAVRALRTWSAKSGVPLVDLGEAVGEDIFSGEANPDGIHWGWEGHAAVARAMVKVLSEVRSVEAGA